MKTRIVNKIAAVTISAMIVMVFAIKVMGTSPVPEVVKLIPSAVSLDASSLPPKLAKAETDGVWRLFDRDTDTAYMPKTTSRVIYSLSDQRNISRIKVYGAASYSLNVYRDNGGLWEPVTSLSNINLEEGALSWNAYKAAEPFTATRILLELIPRGNIDSGISEIEIWGDETSASPDGASTLTLEGLVAPKEIQSILNGKPSHITEYSALPSEISLSENSEKVDQSFVSINLSQNPAAFKRAYITYDGYNLLRPVSIQRRINNLAWSGGFDLPKQDDAAAEWTTHMEEINPSWLVQGENRIEFRSANGTARIRSVRIIVETESGWNSVSSVSDPAVYDGDISTSHVIPSSSSSDYLQINFERTAQPDAVKLHVNGPVNAAASLQYLSGSQWLDVKTGWQVNLSSMNTGWNEIAVPASVTTDAVRLVLNTGSSKLKGGAPSGALDEIRVSASPVGKEGNTRVVVSYPRDGEYFGRTAYIQGFVTPAVNPAGAAWVTVEGKKAQRMVPDGSFSLSLNKDETNFYAQSDDEAWSPTVKADYAVTPGPSATILLNKNSNSTSKEKPEKESREDASFADKREKYSEKVSPGQAKKIRYKGVTLDIPEGAVDTETEITIVPLTEADLARLDPGMVNVTFPDAGYRLLPHGTKFKKPIKLSFGYSKTLFAAGQTDEEANMYFYNESSLQWERLTRVGVDKTLSQVTSETDHFTDIINGTLVVPEHPQALSFNPNSIKDIKAGDPSSGINLIEAPKGNNMGDARLSYPIEIPRGRNGMQPNLAVSYSSGGENGWLGLGWDISVSNITIETRWGVPRYDGSEIYLLDGTQLVDAGGGYYRPRIEGEFRQIKRNGSSPADYWWEVTDKNGKRFIYGKNDQSRLNSYTSDRNIFRWNLEQVIDTNGNTINYTYWHDDVTPSEGEPWTQGYLKEIKYTGHTGGKEGAYTVEFSLQDGLRNDQPISARGGFKVVTRYLLDHIDVKFNSEIVRRYAFEYKKGEFEKSLLSKIKQYGKGGTNLFYEHSLDYFDEVGSGSGNLLNGFSSDEKAWSPAHRVSKSLIFGTEKTGTLGGNLGESKQGHFYGGWAPFSWYKSNSLGMKVGYEENKNETLLALADLNGDGLLDQVYDEDDDVYYRPNLGGPAGEEKFGSAVKIVGLSSIGKEKGKSITRGKEVYYSGLSAFQDKTKGYSIGKQYFSDVNGDGLADFVDNGNVKFNSNIDSVPTFSLLSPVPFGSGQANLEGADAGELPTRAELVEEFYREDPIRRWKAPYTGNIKITGSVNLREAPAADYTTADGVKVSILKGDTVLWAKDIAADDMTAVEPTGVSSIHVNAGESIYFRSNSVDDGSFDSVNWNPEIQYLNVDTTLADENNLPVYSYKASSDFSLAGMDLNWKVPVTGTASLSGSLNKNNETSDDIDIKIFKNGTEVFTKTVLGGYTGDVDTSLSIDLAVQDELTFVLRSDTPIDWTGVSWSPRFTYTSASSGEQLYDENGQPLLVFDVPVRISIYPETEASPISSWTAPKTGRAKVVYAVSPLLGEDGYVYSMPSDYEAKVTLAVKKRNNLIEKTKGVIKKFSSGEINLTTFLDLNQGDILYFVAASTKNDILNYISFNEPKIYYEDEQEMHPETHEIVWNTFYTAPDYLYRARASMEPFGGGFRSWYAGRWNGERETLDQSLMKLPQNEDDVKVFIPMAPDGKKNRWQGGDPECWISGEGMSATRLVEKYLPKDGETPLNGTGMGRGVPRYTVTKSDGIGASAFIAGASHTQGDTQTKVDYFDFNGDRYPDVITSGEVQFTRPDGSMDAGRAGLGFSNIRTNHNENDNLNVSISTSLANMLTDTNSKGKTTGQHSEMPSLGFTGTAGKGETSSTQDFIDVNGDGLPDLVYTSGGKIMVQLNLGYRLGATETWDAGGDFRINKTASVGGSLGAAFDKTGFGFGVGVTTSQSAVEVDYRDLNGDGLPDRLEKHVDIDNSNGVKSDSDVIKVRFNTGHGFGEEYDWRGSLTEPVDFTATKMQNGSAYVEICIPIIIPLPPGFLGCIILNPGGNYGKHLGKTGVGLQDINGDGYPDHVYSDSGGSVTARLNNTGRTNLLKTVYRPLGGKIDLNYERKGNTYDMPQSRWVMKEAKLSDGMGSEYKTNYSYGDGYYDRLERDFYGFDKVTETQAPDTAIERTVTQTYNNRDFFLKGLVQKSVTTDNQGRVWAKSANTYELANVIDGHDVIPGTFFPALKRTDTYYYTGTYNEENYFAKSTSQEYSYDNYGNIVSFIDRGDEGAADDLYAAIGYWKDPSPHGYIVGKPEVIEVKDYSGSRLLRRRSSNYENGTGNLLMHRTLVAANQNSTWNMSYDQYGNIQTISDPVGYTLTYNYDTDAATYVTKITDNFSGKDGGPYYSTADYDLRFGQLAWSRDLSGNYQVNNYDEFGRLSKVYGPYDTNQAGMPTGTPTIAFEYRMPVLDSSAFSAPSAVNNILSPAAAITKNKAVSRIGSDGNTLDTVTYSDGMRRIIQTKKEADVNGTYGMVVSGKVIFDQLGRTIQQGQPISEMGYQTAFTNQPSAKNPTRFYYDTIDRTVMTIAPDNATTTMTYGFGSINNIGTTYFMTKVTDPEGNKVGGANRRGTKVTYKDVDDRILSVVEYNSGHPINTTYEYDPIGQITKIRDNKGNLTTVEYDDAGRRTAIANPDTGRTEYEYDANGNLTAKSTPNYPRGREIKYEYIMNRLVKINYPYITDVEYEYGAMNEAYNRAGRIKKVTDESGIEERYYGKLGETTKEERTVTAAKTPPVSNKKFTTEYAFDSFGRMLEMTYPDGEKLKYAYDNGGLLKAAWGDKSGNRYNYINTLQYDEFGQRTKIEYGNGVKSAYSYDPLTRRLETLITKTSQGSTIQNLSYNYDLVGNILNLGNNISTPTNTALPAGPVAQEFQYDDLYQLTSANGSYSFGPGKQNRYTNVFQYDTIGNMTKKVQIHKIIQPSTQENEPKATNYVLDYLYKSTKPHAVTDAGDKLYSYDNNGNMTGWEDKQNHKKRVITWNEENRVTEISDQGKTTYFTYDDAGERVIKRGQHGETLYINRFYSVRSGELGTKNIYAGETRVLSKLVKTPNTVTANSGTTPGIQGLDHGNGKKLGLIKRLSDNSENVGVTPPVEKDQFYYHGDHLGSSNMITNAYGEVYQHLEYFPYGESWIEEGGSYGGNTPGYKFTGKELDPETGLYYFGARYYEPVLSKWISADPILDQYVHGTPAGGVYRPSNLNLYGYAANNPIIYRDADGRVLDTLADIGFIAYDVASLVYDEVKTGGANRAENLAALGADVGGALVPFTTGGGVAVRAGVRVEKAAAEANRAAKAAEVAADLGQKGAQAGETEIVQRVMSSAELKATEKTGLLRGGKEGTHYVTPAASRDPKRAMQRLSLDPKHGSPEVRATLEVPKGKFGPPTKVEPKHGMPGGGLERTAEGNVPVQIKEVTEMKRPVGGE